jgi:Tol biopolymer transport system component
MAIGLAGLVTAPVAAAAPSTVRVSVSSASAEANAGSGQGGVAVSADGRYVAFLSDASNLVPGDGNGVADVFVRDLRLHTTERVSVSSAGVEGDDSSSADALAISPEGRYVTFTSDATNLAPGNDDTDCAPERCSDVYIRDRTAGTTRRLVPFAGLPTPVHMILSAGARFFAYDVRGLNELARCRRSPRRCIEVGILPPSVQVDEADATPFLGGMSSGGRFILFGKGGFPEPPTVSAGGVFLRDVVAGTTHIVTTNPRDRANALSPQGRFALFTSKSGTLVPNDTNRRADVFVRDRRTGATHRISVSSSEHQANGSSIGIAISSHGRYCLFSSTATNLVAGDTNGETDLFLRDRLHGTTTRVDVSATGAQANGPVRFSALSADGRWAVFGSAATNLVVGDANAVRDVFARGPLH